MMIDPETAKNLELIGNATFKRSHHSLFGCAHDKLGHEEKALIAVTEH
jgi:hypothetical protein